MLKSICKGLAARGISPIKIYEGNEYFDAAIYITADVYIQVNTNYIFIVSELNGQLQFDEVSNNIEEIMSKLKEVVQ